MARAGLGGLVLAGGASRRFGRDKLSVPVAADGTTLLDRALDCCARACDGPVLVASGDGTSRPGLADGQVADLVADAGPLSAVAAGLAALAGRADAVAVVAGDHLAPSPRLLSHLAAVRGTAAVALVVTDRPQPLSAVWATTLAAELADDVRAGARSPTAWLARRGDVVAVGVADLRRVGVDPGALVDVDEPGDLDPPPASAPRDVTPPA